MNDEKYATDFYAKEAKRIGYRARSVFKLKEIDEKYHIIKKNKAILDLGSTPGSFLQYASKKTGKKGVVVGIDLNEIEPLDNPNIFFHSGDIASLLVDPHIATQHLPPKKSYFDVVTADLAPNTSGNKELDHFRSMELNEIVFAVAKKLLMPGGFIVSKMFEGAETQEIIRNLSKDFKKIKMVRPKASSRSRNEIFYVGKRK